MKVPKPKKKVSLVKQLDKLAGELVRARGKCERCGSNQNLQWAHIVTRSAKRIKWDLDNAMCLCKGCHYLFTVKSWGWPVFVDEKFGEGHYMSLHRRANDFSYKVDHKEILERLKQVESSDSYVLS